MSDAEVTIFVVDDDPSVRRSTERLARSMGFNVQNQVYHARSRTAGIFHRWLAWRVLSTWRQ